MQAGVLHAKERNADLLFVTLQKTGKSFSPRTIGLAEPFVFLGPAGLRSWRRARPMQIEWNLAHPMRETA